MAVSARKCPHGIVCGHDCRQCEGLIAHEVSALPSARALRAPLPEVGALPELPKPALEIGTHRRNMEERHFYTPGMAESLGYTFNLKRYYSEDQVLALLEQLKEKTR